MCPVCQKPHHRIDQQRQRVVVVADPECRPPRANKAVAPAEIPPILRNSRASKLQLAIAHMHQQPAVAADADAVSARKLHHYAARRNARRDRQVVFEAGIGMIDQIHARINTRVAHASELRNTRPPARRIAAAQIIGFSRKAPDWLGMNPGIGPHEAHFSTRREAQRTGFRQQVAFVDRCAPEIHSPAVQGAPEAGQSPPPRALALAVEAACANASWISP